MATVLLVRHGLTALTGPILAGWTPGVHLDERGRRQAEALAARLASLPLAVVVSSPLERCQETAQAILAARDHETGRPQVDERLGEVRYGAWTGRPLKRLARQALWRVVQAHPSAARFPRGESLLDVQHRAVAAIRDWNARLGPDAAYLVCTHGDVIKAIVADALALHLDNFQRIRVDPCSLTVIHYTELRPFLVRLNDVGGRVDDVVPPPRRRRLRRRRLGDAAVGGGAGGGAAAAHQ